MTSFLTNIFNSIGKALSNEQTIETEVEQTIVSGTANYVAFQSGEAVKIATVTLDGQVALVIAIKPGGTTAQTLGF